MRFFDTQWYLRLYPDVAEAVSAGLIGSAEEHFQMYGKSEGRSPSSGFDVAYYLSQNADVASMVATGATTAYDHYVAYGAAEGRSGSSFFNPTWYLAHNPDVAQAVEEGLIESAADHFFTYGANEFRSASALFDPAMYLALNPDVAAAGVSPIDHFVMYGIGENRTVSPIFDAAAYLAANPDVAEAVAQGYITAHDHFQTYGLYEPRDLGNGINLSFFASDPAFQAGLESGDIAGLIARVAEIAPFVPGYEPPAHYSIPSNTPIPTDFVPPAGQNLVIPDGIDVPDDADLPEGFTPAATFVDGQLVIADGVQATITNVDGVWTISAHNLRSIEVSAADLAAFNIGANAQLNVSGAILDGLELDVSGAGKLNVTDVVFGDIQAGALNAPDLTGLAFADVADGHLLSSQLLVNGSVEDAFQALWIAFDKAYYGTGDYYDLRLNTLKVELANSYVDYLADGNAPLLQIVQTKVGGVPNYDQRAQSLHDNILGELNNGSIDDRFAGHPDGPQPDPRTQAALEFGDRPWFSGNVGSDPVPTKAWDFAHDIPRDDYISTSAASDGDVAGNNGYLWTGTGISAEGFHTAVHDGAGIELGLKGVIRGSGEDTFASVDENGYAHYAIDGGPGANSNWASNWSFNFSIETQQTGVSQAGLTGYNYNLLIDIDPSEATNFVTLTMVDVGGGVTPWLMNGQPVLADDMNANAPENIYQQSVNFGFEAIKDQLPEGYNFNDGGIFDIRLEAYLPDQADTPLVSTGIVLDVSPHALAA